MAGRVLDETKAGVPGATVIVKGSTRGVITGNDGTFSIDVKPTDVIEISYLGYETQSIPVGTKTNIVTELVRKVSELEAVTVVAYGKQRKESIIGAINTIDIGDGLHVRVGRYGPYLEDMEHLDAEGNPKRASLPDTIAPDELTVAVARDLIDNHSGGPRELGVDPVSGGTVEVRNGRFGPYVALVPPAEASAGAAGDTAGASAAKKGSKKAAAAAASRPKMASLFKTMSPESLSLEDALKLLSLPREVGTYEETNAETGEVSECTVAANNGRYGPYLTKTGADGKSETRSLASEDEIFTVDIDKAKELFSQPKYGRGRGRGAAKPPLRDLGKDPNTGKNVTIKDGRFGAYITDGETNRTVPRQYTPESITPDDAFRLLAEKRAAGPSTRGRRCLPACKRPGPSRVRL